MCVIFFYANSNPSSAGGYKLILASNRDEHYARPTKEVSQFDGPIEAYGGMDMEPGREGGTWLAISCSESVFKVGALLNLTGEPKSHHDVGRGMIVSDFVASKSGCSIQDYNDQMLEDCTKYSAFNFISIQIGERSEPARISLLSNKPPNLLHYDEGECYGFGNSLPDAPFRKVVYGTEKFQEVVENFNNKLHEVNDNAKGDDSTDKQKLDSENKLIKDLQDLLKCPKKFWPDDELKRRAPTWGEGLSSLNVRIDEHAYGSRTHSVILVDSNNRMRFIEQTMASVDPEGEWKTSDITRNFN